MAGKIIWDTRKNCSEYPAEIKKIYFGKYLKLRKEYTKWVGNISKPFANDIDWWVSIPSSRNTNFSKIYDYLCILETLKHLKSRELEIIISSRSFLTVIRKSFKERKNFIFIYKKEKIKKNNLISYFKAIFFQIFIYLIIKFFFKKDLSFLKNKTLINNYPNNDINKPERHFQFSKKFLKQNFHKINFIPSFIPTKKIFNLIKIINLISKKNYFFKENILNFSDLFFAFFYVFRLKKFKAKYKNFNNYDLSSVIYDEIKNLKHYSACMIGILNYKFVKKISQKEIKIKKTFCWLENHEVRGWNLGFRNFYKNIKTCGYQGFTNLPQLMNTIPAKHEEKFKVIPELVVVSAKAYTKARKEFFSKLKIQVGPALVYKKVFENAKMKNTMMFLVILTEVAHVNLNLIKWIQHSLKKNKNLHFTIKKPKILNVDKLINSLKFENNVKFTDRILTDLFKNTNYVITSGPTGATLEALAYNCKLLIPFTDPYDKKYLNSIKIPKKNYKIFQDKKEFSTFLSLLIDRNINKRQNKIKKFNNLRNFLFQKVSKTNEKIFI